MDSLCQSIAVCTPSGCVECEKLTQGRIPELPISEGGGKNLFGWSAQFVLTITFAVAAVLFGTIPASANNCLQDVASQHLNCTANDVSIAKAVNPRDLSGNPIATCFAGTKFSFIADFNVVTTATARENIGFFMATNGQSSALTGICTDNIVSPLHAPGKATPPTGGCTQTGGTGLCVGSALYHELDTSLTGDNCGDTQSADGTNQFVTVEIDNITCPNVGATFVLPNCTSWQQPGGAQLCTSSPSSGWPWVAAAVPGSPSKCNCSTVSIPITPISYTISATKTPNPTTLPEPGGVFTYTVGVSNQSNTALGTNGEIAINEICDDQFGQIARASMCNGGTNALASCTSNTDCPGGTCFTPNVCPAGKLCSSPNNVAGTTCATPVSCSLPQIVAAGATNSSLCSFTGTYRPGTEGSLKDTVATNGLGFSGSAVNASANATVTVSEGTPVVSVSKTLDSGRECAVVRYKVAVSNTSANGTDETETLSTVTDTSFGDITRLQGNVLGTTCGVASTSAGLGTLSGSLGAGALPATISVGGSYTCEFDGEFCGALGPAGTCTTGIENIDTVNASVAGDESGDVVTGSTSASLTVDACFTHNP